MVSSITPQIRGIIIGIVIVMVGFAFLDLGGSFRGSLVFPATGIVAIIGGLAILGFSIKSMFS
jgi:hypothetical protein